MSINDQSRFDDAITRIDARLSEDPRREDADGQPQPRELLFAIRVYDWVNRLEPNPSEALLLAARSHTLGRWEVARDDYPKTKPGYRAWRNACAEQHAVEAEKILMDVGYSEEIRSLVRDFILKKNWPADAEACTLEDADCLVFLESKLAMYLDEWEDEKTINILRKTARKMTPKAREQAINLDLTDRERDLLTAAIA